MVPIGGERERKKMHAWIVADWMDKHQILTAILSKGWSSYFYFWYFFWISLSEHITIVIKKNKCSLYTPARIYTKRISQIYQHIGFVYIGKSRSFKQSPLMAWKIESKHQPDGQYVLYEIYY